MTYVHVLDFVRYFQQTFLSFVQQLFFLLFFNLRTKLLGRECGPFLFTVLPWFTYLHTSYNGTANDAVLDLQLLAATNFKFKIFLALTVKDFPSNKTQKLLSIYGRVCVIVKRDLLIKQHVSS